MTIKKKIWIFNHHANSMFFDNGGRHYCFAKYLKRRGYEPVIFCSNAKHGTGELCFDDLGIWKEYINENIDVPFVFVKGRPYVGNGKNRILCMVDYYKNVKKAASEYAKEHGCPDTIIGSQVHPLAVLAAEQMARKYGIKAIAEFRDLWPESIVAMGIASAKNPIIIMLRMLEKKLYKDSDAIVFTVAGGYDYISERGWNKTIPREKVHHINNGVDLEDYRKNISESLYHDEDLDKSEYFKVIYAGSIRQANGLDELIESASLLKDNKMVRFFIYGAGDYRERLQEKVIAEKLSNVVFKGKIPKKDIPYILSKSDLNLLNYNAAAATAGFYRFGSSQNKLFEYLASGKPILSNFCPKYDLIESNSCGIARNMLSAKDYVKGLNEIISMDDEQYNKICMNSIKVAEEYDYAKLTQALVCIIENI